ncbi:hypothetical protein Mgra_00007843 [Meloidogyne graminicola]|uniref:Uncharacterized protein n=1 Tax=Meloidogyne graminicola TaxID=189291 RepID=A0A8S9ZHH9_9BILA|nr:hypothetical protein Mgra_00007843 [Meloidogyne graminicola]
MNKNKLKEKILKYIVGLKLMSFIMLMEYVKVYMEINIYVLIQNMQIHIILIVDN